MKVRITNPITGRSRVARARLTTEHPASHYGIPVLLIEGEVYGPGEAIMHGVRLFEPPRAKAQVEMLTQWQENAQAMVG